MLFNSTGFLLFFLFVTSFYFILPHRFRWLLLLGASCYFYIKFIPVYILILFFTITIDYFAGICIEQSASNEKRRRALLIGSIIANIGILVLFKYWDFLANNISHSLAIELPLLKDLWLSGWILTANNDFNSWANGFFGTSYPILQNVILPLGLSFHTFQALSYLIEVYRGNQKAERHFGIYSLYVMFYPQLVAGPIERPQNILPQFRVRHHFSWELLTSGIRLMLWGFFKKVVVADRLSQYVYIIYQQPMLYSNAGNVFIAFLFFIIQVYCDFSAYSDIALGAARTMGFNLMINFNRPLQSRSISEFWRRWHISLSSWLNDYLFVNVAAATRRLRIWGIAIAVLVTFGLSGLWHGAAWTFIVFGLLHGIGIVYEILTRGFRKKLGQALPATLWNSLCWTATFLFATITVVFFRAENMGQALQMLKWVFTLHWNTPFQTALISGKEEFGITSWLLSLGVITITFLVERFTTSRLLEFNEKPFKDIVFCTCTVLLILFLGKFDKDVFIYFQF